MVATHRARGWLTRHASAVRWTSIAVLAAGLVIIGRTLPIREGLAAVGHLLAGLGLFAPLALGAVYVLATVLALPGVPLTLAAGAIFGPWVGTVTVSLASTTGAALAFLIARHLARGRVEARLRRSPLLRAVDGAITEGGWRMVALLRLSPAVPFNLQNYLYGVTGLRFWPCVLTSWVAMLPGTFLYVYLGYLGRETAEAAAGADAAGGSVWAVRAVGLVATVAVVVYATRLARRHLRRQPALEAAAAEPPARSVGGTLALSLLALLAAAGAVAAVLHADRLGALFGPPRVMLTESYAEKPAGPTMDHAEWDALLREHVRPGGLVDYDGFARDEARLERYLAAVAAAPLDEMGRSERLALLINAYNAFTVRLILDHRPLRSIKDIPGDQRWTGRRWPIGGHAWTLDEIEHTQVRPHFREPRIHFALVCAAVGCPPLRDEAYVAARLEAQLEAQTEYVHGNPRWVRYDAAAGALALSPLYQWYGDDFRQVAGSVPAYVARYVPALRAALDAGRTPEVRFLDYDWSLNSVENAPPGPVGGGALME